MRTISMRNPIAMLGTRMNLDTGVSPKKIKKERKSRSTESNELKGDIQPTHIQESNRLYIFKLSLISPIIPLLSMGLLLSMT